MDNCKARTAAHTVASFAGPIQSHARSDGPAGLHLLTRGPARLRGYHLPPATAPANAFCGGVGRGGDTRDIGGVPAAAAVDIEQVAVGVSTRAAASQRGVQWRAGLRQEAAGREEKQGCFEAPEEGEGGIWIAR